MSQEGFKRKLTAILSADADGYSRLMAEDEAATVKIIATYQMILKFSLPNHTQPFTLKGKIDWSGPRGFGVKLNEMAAQQGDLLKTYVNQKD